MLYDEPASRTGMRKAEKIGIWLGAVTLVVSSAIAIGAWWWPRGTDDSAPPGRTGAAATGRPTASTAPAAVHPVHRDDVRAHHAHRRGRCVEELTIQVQCESPEGVVVLTDAALTPTG